MQLHGDCPDGNCVVAAIDRQLQVLKSNAPAGRRLLALKYFVHLAADVHQPLHAGYAEDRHGNMYQLQAFMRGSNLHALWDFGLIKNVDMSNEALTARLRAKPVVSGSPIIPRVKIASARTRLSMAARSATVTQDSYGGG